MSTVPAPTPHFSRCGLSQRLELQAIRHSRHLDRLSQHQSDSGSSPTLEDVWIRPAVACCQRFGRVARRLGDAFGREVVRRACAPVSAGVCCGHSFMPSGPDSGLEAQLTQQTCFIRFYLNLFVCREGLKVAHQGLEGVLGHPVQHPVHVGYPVFRPALMHDRLELVQSPRPAHSVLNCAFSAAGTCSFVKNIGKKRNSSGVACPA